MKKKRRKKREEIGWHLSMLCHSCPSFFCSPSFFFFFADRRFTRKIREAFAAGNGVFDTTIKKEQNIIASRHGHMDGNFLKLRGSPNRPIATAASRTTTETCSRRGNAPPDGNNAWACTNGQSATKPPALVEGTQTERERVDRACVSMII